MPSQPGQDRQLFLGFGKTEMSQEMEEADGGGWAWAWVEALCLLLAELTGSVLAALRELYFVD